MRFYLEYYTYLALILVAFIASISRRKSSREDNILSTLLLLTFISELLATIFTQVYQNNLIIYHFFTPIQFLLLTFYFNSIIDTFKEKQIGIKIGITGAFISVTNSFFIQKKEQMNSFFLLLEGLTIIALTLHFFYRTMLLDKKFLFRNKHLWIGMIFLLFWSATYAFWALSEAASLYSGEYKRNIIETLLFINIITYGSLSIVFILNKKQILHNGH